MRPETLFAVFVLEVHRRLAGSLTGRKHYLDLNSALVDASHHSAQQLAGLAGFPFWGHDAGGFYDWDEQAGPDESLYQRWAMALGSFAPIWKPHGMGASRWPLDRNERSLEAAHRFGRLRYELMPYLYSAAHANAYYVLDAGADAAAGDEVRALFPER